MAHRSFEAARLSEAREPITFDFGLYGQEQFTVTPDPSLGDTLELYGLPDDIMTLDRESPTYTKSIQLLTRFIRRMLRAEDRERFDKALYAIPSTQSYIIVEVAEWICEQVVPVPSKPPTS
jgi:hypothetical protein